VAEDGVQAVAVASAIRAVLEGHLARENEQLLPLLARTPYVSLADLVGGTDALVGPLPVQPAAVRSPGSGAGQRDGRTSRTPWAPRSASTITCDRNG
jgi:hypothetical protein